MTTQAPLRISLVFLLALFMSSCHRAEMSNYSTQGSMASFQGRILWNKTPIKKATLFLRPEGVKGKEIELMTRTDGRFEISLAPGRYRLRSSPTTMCPVRGMIDLKRGVNKYRLYVHPVSFLTCKPGTIQKMGH